MEQQEAIHLIRNDVGTWNKNRATGQDVPNLDGCNFANLGAMEGADLKGLSFVGADFTDADLRGADLSGSNFSGATMIKTDFSLLDPRPDLNPVSCQDVNFSNADLTGAKFHRVDLREVKMGRAKLHGTNFSEANLTGVDLTECNAEKPFFAGANLTKVRLTGLTLMAVNFNNATLTEADLSNATMTEAKLSGADLKSAKLAHATLHKASFVNAKLNGANLRKADLTEAVLREADVRNADFTGAILKDADFSKTICDGANFFLAKHLYGRYQVTADDVKGAANANFFWVQDHRPNLTAFCTWCRNFPSWAFLRTFGSLPLFGVSYFGIIAIWLWTTLARIVNHRLRILKTLEEPAEIIWVKRIPEIQIPWDMGWTLGALLMLAAATTIYKVACPKEIQESSEVRWIHELGNNALTYQGLSFSRFVERWLTAIFYLIGGPWIVYLLGRHVWETLNFLIWNWG